MARALLRGKCKIGGISDAGRVFQYQVFSEAEIKRVTLRAFPRLYQVQVSKSGRSLEEYTLTTLQEFLEVCMVDGEKDAQERTNSDKNKKIK